MKCRILKISRNSWKEATSVDLWISSGARKTRSSNTTKSPFLYHAYSFYQNFRVASISIFFAHHYLSGGKTPGRKVTSYVMDNRARIHTPRISILICPSASANEIENKKI